MQIKLTTRDGVETFKVCLIIRSEKFKNSARTVSQRLSPSVVYRP